MSGLKKALTPVGIALGFLTIVPVPALGETSKSEQGRALLWYPLVGLFIGLMLLLPQCLNAPAYLLAGMILLVWVAITGALHLDGLADCADAWLGGLGDKERTLELLKDPLCGSMAVVALVLVLLMKYLAITTLLAAGQGGWLVWVPVLARLGLLPLFLTTPYVREGGLGEVLAQHFPRQQAWLLVALTLVLLLSVTELVLWIATVLILALTVWFLRRAFIRRLDGFTGDCAGAMVEISELVLLFVMALMLSA